MTLCWCRIEQVSYLCSSSLNHSTCQPILLLHFNIDVFSDRRTKLNVDTAFVWDNDDYNIGRVVHNQHNHEVQVLAPISKFFHCWISHFLQLCYSILEWLWYATIEILSFQFIAHFIFISVNVIKFRSSHINITYFFVAC